LGLDAVNSGGVLFNTDSNGRYMKASQFKLSFVFHVMGMPFDGSTIKTSSLGGSETAAYYQAKELAARGHEVVMFTNTQNDGVYDGVTYIGLGDITAETPLGSRFDAYATKTPHDVLIIQRHPTGFHKQYASKVNIWQLHDLALFRTTTVANHGMWNINAVTCVSEWHKNQVAEVYGFDKDFIKVVPNGVDLSLYTTPDDEVEVSQVPEDLRTKFLMLYQSRPERGLEHLVREGGIMDKLSLALPNIHLAVVGYDNTTAHMAEYYAYLNDRISKLPNVTHLGAFDKRRLASLQKECDLLIYPTEFEEVSCITAMEAMAAGLPMLTTDCAALPETTRGSGTITILLENGKVNEDLFVSKVMEIGKRDNWLLRANRQAQKAAAQHRSWGVAVDKLCAVVDECFEQANGSLAAKMRHCIEYSDTEILNALVQSQESSDSRIVVSTHAEYSKLYDFTVSSDAYAVHYTKHQTEYYDRFEEQVIGEDVTQSTRFAGVYQHFVKAIQEIEAREPDKQIRVLDYGCAHGHYLIPLAKLFPCVSFTGMDISARAIGAAMKWARRDNVANAAFKIGSQEDLAEVRGQYDIVFAGEVIEHVPDYDLLIEQLAQCLIYGGRLIATTPVGPWEWTGTEAFKTGREHLHHFDKRDIEELSHSMGTDLILNYAPAGADATGRALGSYVWSITVNTETTPGHRSIERKMTTMAPRQTVSACLIVKDGERTLRRCLESFIDWVDEIVIAIDPATKDRTTHVIQAVQEDWPLKPFTVMEGVSPLTDGFDAARNRSVDAATGDWILWVDADEEVQNPQALWKYLRPSHHQAIGFPQIHYAVDPPSVLTTDYPCRLFRNNSGIQFYGLVHEHPETEPGKSVPHAVVRHDVQFLHNGYVSEVVRRARYQRNLPLLLRDLKEYPSRSLNKFLFLRDVGQGIAFNHERHGHVGPSDVEQAKEGIKVFEELVALENGNIRLIVDAIPYYGMCAKLMPNSFEVDIGFSCSKEPLRDLAVKANVKGTFHDVELLKRLINMLTQESTKHYESKYQ
jgi:glycosyltransferase involved in cell wall biosynthesis/2-polyprenyl-3-methyl-5-hydroxy-6-metoxy-1,4-benzoquinol methylase